MATKNTNTVQLLSENLFPVVGYLLNNALKFHRETEAPVVTIAFITFSADPVLDERVVIAGGPFVEIVFSGNGTGFEQQYASQIFQLFERLHPVEEYEGAGLGLAFCKKVVENHHGQIFAVSDENMGAAFHAVLPVKQN